MSLVTNDGNAASRAAIPAEPVDKPQSKRERDETQHVPAVEKKAKRRKLLIEKKQERTDRAKGGAAAQRPGNGNTTDALGDPTAQRICHENRDPCRPHPSLLSVAPRRGAPKFGQKTEAAPSKRLDFEQEFAHTTRAREIMEGGGDEYGGARWAKPVPLRYIARQEVLRWTWTERDSSGKLIEKRAELIGDKKGAEWSTNGELDDW